MRNKKGILFKFVLLIFGITMILGFNFLLKPKTDLGSKNYTLEVICGHDVYSFSGSTDAEYLSGLLEELKDNNIRFTYKTEESKYGKYLVSVMGIDASENDHTYWSIYVNGDYGQFGIDEQLVLNDDKYTLKLESFN